MIFSLGLIVALIVINGVFSGTEMALVTLRESQISDMEKQSKSARVAAKLARSPNQFLATIQIGITLAGFLAAAVAATSISEPIANLAGNIFSPLETPVRATSLIAVTLMLSYVTLVFGELAPKRIAMRNAQKWATITAYPLNALSKILSPAVALLSWSTNLSLKLVGINGKEQREEINTKELQDIIISHRAINDQQRNIMRGAFEVTGRRVGKIACPRNQIVWLQGNIKCGEARKILTQTEFSRAPVSTTEDLDDIAGIVHLRDLLDAPPTKLVKNVVRKVPFYPESNLVLPTMHTMQTERINMAIIINEYGTVTGLITLEDLIEEIVGEIYDDYDKPTKQHRTNKSGELVLPGNFPLYDLAELEVVVNDGPYSTLAGYLLYELGSLPEKTGDTVITDEHVFTITKVAKRRIEQVTVTSTPATTSQQETSLKDTPGDLPPPPTPNQTPPK